MLSPGCRQPRIMARSWGAAREHPYKWDRASHPAQSTGPSGPNLQPPRPSCGACQRTARSGQPPPWLSGLMIVDTVANAWGVEPDEAGKKVWFELAAAW